jgi:hypothetical protein
MAMKHLLLVILALSPISSFASNLNINIHKSQIETSYPLANGEHCLIIKNLTEKRAKSLAQELEVYAGPGIQQDSNAKVVAYIYKLSPSASMNKVIFRGLQLNERSNSVRIQTGSNSSLAEAFESSGFGAEPVQIELSKSCK